MIIQEECERPLKLHSTTVHVDISAAATTHPIVVAQDMRVKFHEAHVYCTETFEDGFSSFQVGTRADADFVDTVAIGQLDSGESAIFDLDETIVEEGQSCILSTVQNSEADGECDITIFYELLPNVVEA